MIDHSTNKLGLAPLTGVTVTWAASAEKILRLPSDLINPFEIPLRRPTLQHQVLTLDISQFA